VYQEAGTTRQRLVQRRVLLVMREEEALLLHPAPDNGNASAETMNGQERWVAAGTVGADLHRAFAMNSSCATGRKSDAGAGGQTLLSAKDAWGKDFPDVPRSPPGSPARVDYYVSKER